MENTSVAIITLNYNQTNYTIDCIKSVLNSTHRNFKIFLIDNGSKKKEFKNLKENFNNNTLIEIFRLPSNIGYVGGVNFGLEKASTHNFDYFLIMNNDTLIDSQSIRELVFTSEKYNGKAIVSGKVYNYDEKDTLQIDYIKSISERIIDIQAGHTLALIQLLGLELTRFNF